MIDSGLISKLSPRVDVVLPMTSEQLTPPMELDGPMMKYRCNKLTKVINLLMDILYVVVGSNFRNNVGQS